jgi:hypothetical protein
MESQIKRKLTKKNQKKLILLLITVLISGGIIAQNNQSVTGTVIDKRNNQPVPYATVCLVKTTTPESRSLNGTISNEIGKFLIQQVQPGKYRLMVTSVGYTPSSAIIDVTPGVNTDAGIISLQDSVILTQEAVVVGERTRGKSEENKTVFYINKSIVGASGSVPDVLRHIPGIQVDLRQNISLEGSQNILIYVDGKERDKSFLSQLNPGVIDRIEVLNTPPSGYDGNVSGVINIILKKDKDMGISGQVFTEIPTSKSIVYSFPSYSIIYGSKKLNLFTSYNGEINYENIDEVTDRKITDSPAETDISSVQHVRQKNLGHKFHYGFDYFLSEHNMVNYYGSFNPYSYEQDGNVIVKASGIENQTWETRKEETDRNRNIYNSVYFKHIFNKKGRDLVAEFNNSFLRSANTTEYLNITDSDPAVYMNKIKPGQVTTGMKIDYTSPLGSKLNLSTGMKTRFQTMKEETSSDFRYNENIYAVYGALNYQQLKYSFSFGLRAEDEETELRSGGSRSQFSVLPYSTLRYKINSRQNIQLSYRRSVNRPSIYQLNPYIYTSDPYTVQKGNPMLEPEFRSQMQLEHSMQFRSNYFSYRLFYDRVSNAINNLTFLNDSSAFESQVNNLGTINIYGIQLLGSLKYGPLSFSPVIRFYGLSTSCNETALQHGTKDRNQMVLETSFSSVLSFRHDFAFSVIFQYSTPKNNIQSNSFYNALYFTSLDKTFKKDLKIGILSALPLTGKFVYQGSETNAHNFSSYYTGNLKLPTFPVMFRISYQFNPGQKRARIERDTEEIANKSKPGM